MILKCIICKKKATKRYSPDLDIVGIGSCDKHNRDVFLGYAMLIQGDEEMFWDFIKGNKDYVKEKTKKRKVN